MMPYDVGKYAVSMGTNPTLVETKGLMPLTDSEYR
jgi:hypothetical protein